MYRIGICDDDQYTCAELENMIEEYAKQIFLEVEILHWYSGEKLCDYLIKDEEIDFLFLDIELIEINGVDVGKFIREKLDNYKIGIIYISIKQSYAMQLFKTEPIDFLVKPIQQIELNKVIDRCIRKSSQNNYFFEFQYNKSNYKVYYDNIIYFQSNNKKIQIIMKNGAQEYYGKLKEVAEKVIAKNFIWIHKSFLINPLYVSKLSYETVTMINGDILGISKTNRKKVRQLFLNTKGRINV